MTTSDVPGETAVAASVDELLARIAGEAIALVEMADTAPNLPPGERRYALGKAAGLDLAFKWVKEQFGRT